MNIDNFSKILLKRDIKTLAGRTRDEKRRFAQSPADDAVFYTLKALHLFPEQSGNNIYFPLRGIKILRVELTDLYMTGSLVAFFFSHSISSLKSSDL